MRVTGCVLLLVLAGSLVAQEKSKWRRVYTYDDSFIEMEVIKLSFGNFGRVRFRTVYDKPETLRGITGVKYKSHIEDMELMCAQRRYRVTGTDFLDARGKVIRSYKADESEGWKVVRFGSMMEKLFVPACRMIAEKKL
jgi:hypothetical protein